MKRTPLRRSRRPIRRKGKSVKAQCVELFMRQYRGKPCEVCASQGVKNSVDTCGHHIIKRSVAPHLVCEPRNIVVTCDIHHNALHDADLIVVKGWYARHRPDDYAWLQAHRNDKTRPNYRAMLHELKHAP
jgi:hypothetical protein